MEKMLEYQKRMVNSIRRAEEEIRRNEDENNSLLEAKLEQRIDGLRSFEAFFNLEPINLD